MFNDFFFYRITISHQTPTIFSFLIYMIKLLQRDKYYILSNVLQITRSYLNMI